MLDSKVALFSEEFPPSSFGGIGTVTSDLANNLSERKVATTVFCGRSRKIAIERPNDYLEIVRLPYFDLPPRFLWFQLQNFKTILNQRKEYVVLHSVSHQMGFLGTYLKKKLNRPLITSYHGVPFYTDLMSFANSPPSSWTFGDFGYSFLEFPLNEALIKFGLNNSDRIVTCSKTTLSELETRYRNVNFKKSLVIPNGVDFEKLLKIKNGFTEEDINANSSPSILFAGRLYYLKGITYLLEAFELLVGDFPDLRLNIFGTGPMESKIRKTILNQGLEKKIVLHGLVARNQLMQEILKADVAVFPSLREAQPMVVLEAMAFGKPVIAFDFAFAQEIIKDQDTGLLAKRMDARELANGIRILLSDKKTRAQIGQNGCSYVKKHHNWKTLINQYVDLYENVAKEAPH